MNNKIVAGYSLNLSWRLRVPNWLCLGMEATGWVDRQKPNSNSSQTPYTRGLFLVLKILALLSAGHYTTFPGLCQLKPQQQEKIFGWPALDFQFTQKSKYNGVYNYYYSPFIIPQAAGYVQQNFQKIFFILYENFLA